MPGITFTQGSGVADSIYGKSQNPIKMFIEKKGEAFEAQSVLPELFLMTTSENFGEEITSMTAMNGFRPGGENEAFPNDEMREGYSKFLKHVSWRDKFSISREMVEDSKLMDLKKKPQAFVTGYYRTRERFGNALYGAALGGATSVNFEGTNFDITTGDKKALFDKAHPSIINGKTQSNKFSDAFSVDALAAAETAMQNFKGDNGEILDITPDTIIIPNEYSLKKAVFAAIGADKDPATANNGFNYQFGRWNVIVSPYLNQYIASGALPWMLTDRKYIKDTGAAVWYDRTPLDVESYIDQNTRANAWTGFARFVAGFSDWRFAAAGGITGGTALIS